MSADGYGRFQACVRRVVREEIGDQTRGGPGGIDGLQGRSRALP